MKAFALSAGKSSDLRSMAPTLVTKFSDFSHVEFVPLSDTSKVDLIPSRILPAVDLSTPQAIADAAEKALFWLEPLLHEGNGIEAHFEIEQFSQQLANASHVLHEQFHEHSND